LADVVLVDIIEDMPQGKRSTWPRQHQSRVMIADSSAVTAIKETADSDIVVITSGIARKPGMSRDDLVNTNKAIVKQVTEEVVKYSRTRFL